MLRKSAFLREPKTITYIDVNKVEVELAVETGSLFFTYCQVPVIYKIADENSITVLHRNGSTTSSASLELNASESAKVFGRTGMVTQLTVQIQQTMLK
jgi:hypothetical protein